MHYELLMKYNPTSVLPNQPTSPALDCEEEDGTLYYYKGEDLIGQMSVYIEGSRVCLYDVEIMEEYRNRGLGKAMLYHFLTEEYPYLHEIFPVNKCKRELVLQVSQQNEPACRLYRSFGFEVIESVIINES